MYNAIIKSNIKKAFQLLNDHNYLQLSKGLSLNIHHHFSGDHALGGTRNDQAAVKEWFDRVGRLLPNLKLTVNNIIVRGWPNNTLAIVQWQANATLKDGSEYLNDGVHFIRVKWGKITEMNVYEDSQAVANALEKQFQSGIVEAKATQIIS
jgi:ketosteroid isomerase-like protein